VSHTPGPWHIHKYDTETTRDSIGIFSKSDPDTKCFRRDLVVEGVWGSSFEQCDANTRLIAAAPELLDALRNCLQVMFEDVNTREKARREAHAVIAKIEQVAP